MTQPGRLTHTDESGHARMVDVSGKDVTVREAHASGRVLLSPEAIAALRASMTSRAGWTAIRRGMRPAASIISRRWRGTTQLRQSILPSEYLVLR